MTELARTQETAPRPYRKYAVEQMIEALEHGRGLIAPAARYLGCSRDTIRSYMAEHPEIAKAIEDASEAVNDMTELKLFDAIERGEGWAICFRLKTRAKNRGYVEKAEIAGAGGGPVKLKLVYDE